MSIPCRLACTLALMSVAAIVRAQPAPLPETTHSEIEYPSPGAAWRALRADPHVQFEDRGGWMIANDPAHATVWTFSPQGDPAFPALVKRHVVERDGQLMMNMSVLCGASKQACDDFVRRFQRLNEDMARALQQKRPAPAASSASAP